jgi:hypothetical protein
MGFAGIVALLLLHSHSLFEGIGQAHPTIPPSTLCWHDTFFWERRATWPGFSPKNCGGGGIRVFISTVPKCAISIDTRFEYDSSITSERFVRRSRHQCGPVTLGARISTPGEPARMKHRSGEHPSSRRPSRACCSNDEHAFRSRLLGGIYSGSKVFENGHTRVRAGLERTLK